MQPEVTVSVSEFLTYRRRAMDSPTVTVSVPTPATSPAEIAAVSFVALTNVVARLAAFHCTVEPAMNPVPFTVSVKSALPAPSTDGEIEVSDGSGFAAIVKSCANRRPASGRLVEDGHRGGARVLRRSAARIVAVISVELVKLVARFDPFHRTFELGVNPEPLTVNVKFVPPTGSVFGESDEVMRATRLFHGKRLRRGRGQPAARRGNKHLHCGQPAIGDVRGGDLRGNLCGAHDRTRARRAIPIHRRPADEAGAGDGQRGSRRPRGGRRRRDSGHRGRGIAVDRERQRVRCAAARGRRHHRNRGRARWSQ